MKKVFTQSTALPVDPDQDVTAEPRAFSRNRFGPAIGVAIAFGASLVLWSILGNIIRLAFHAVF